MQIERLVQMVFYIAGREHITAKELAAHFRVSTRTIYRDLNTLSLAGIPIMSAKGTGGGIFLLDGYTIEKPLLSREEQQNILQGLQILQASNYPNAEITLSKIGAVFRNGWRWIFPSGAVMTKKKLRFPNCSTPFSINISSPLIILTPSCRNPIER